MYICSKSSLERVGRGSEANLVCPEPADKWQGNLAGEEKISQSFYKLYERMEAEV